MSKGNHTSDPLPAPVAPELIAGNPWYSTRSKDYIKPSIDGGTLWRERAPTAPVPAPKRGSPRHPGRHRKRAPHRKLRPRYVTAAVFTSLIAVPALWMASDLASRSPEATSPAITINTVAVPVIVHNGTVSRAICVYVYSSGPEFKAWATPASC